MTPATYSAREKLRDGRLVHIRALRPDDEAGMLDAVNKTNSDSLRRRFFVTKRNFSEQEKAFFLRVDFVKHVALVALIEGQNGESIVGGGRYIVTEAGKAEVAFVVIDAYQGHGIGTILTRHLARLAENSSMRKVLGKFGFQLTPAADPQVIHMTLTLNSRGGGVPGSGMRK